MLLYVEHASRKKVHKKFSVILWVELSYEIRTTETVLNVGGDSILNRIQTSRHQEDSPPTISTPQVACTRNQPPLQQVRLSHHNVKSLCHQPAAQFFNIY